jgi:hypothetical protein
MGPVFVAAERVVWIEVGSPIELVEDGYVSHLIRHGDYLAAAITIREYDATWILSLEEMLELARELDRRRAEGRLIDALALLLDALMRAGPAVTVGPDERPDGRAMTGIGGGVWLAPGRAPERRPDWPFERSTVRRIREQAAGRSQPRAPSPPDPDAFAPSPPDPDAFAPSPPASHEPAPHEPASMARSRRLGPVALMRGALEVLRDLRSRPQAEPPPPSVPAPPAPPAPTGLPAPTPPPAPVDVESPAIGGGAAAALQIPPPPSETLTRTPHLQTDRETLAPGAAFTFAVWCDTGPPLAGEAAQPVVLVAPPEQRIFDLEVWIAASPHFELERRVDTLRLDRDVAASPSLTFIARVVDDPPPGAGLLSAQFSYNNRACGQVARLVAIEGAAAPQPPAPDADLGGPPARPPRIVVRTGETQPDLTVEIRSLDDEGRTFDVRVLPRGATDVEPVRWKLAESLPDMVADYMKDFTTPGLGDDERRSKLLGAGMALWDEAPKAFTSAFWSLAETLRSILIVTDEWSFPWELLVPVRGHGTARETRAPLGVTYQIGRWVTSEGLSPQQEIPLTDSYAFAPDYGPGLALDNAPAEAQYVCRHFAGTLIDPGNFTAIEAFFGRGGVSLVHFVCHGEAPVGKSQAIALCDGTKLLAHQLAAMNALAGAVAKTEPLIFLNACEIGRGAPALIGPGGFATAFIDLGARGVIAPLWSVDDKVAHDVAIAFYDAVRAQPTTPLSEIVRTLRARAYDDGGADTWAAYCLYSDPLARVDG